MGCTDIAVVVVADVADDVGAVDWSIRSDEPKQKELMGGHIWVWVWVFVQLKDWDENEIESALDYWHWRLIEKKGYVANKGERRVIVELEVRRNVRV